MYCMMLVFVRFRDGYNPGGFLRLGKHPKRKHLFESLIQKEGRILCIFLLWVRQSRPGRGIYCPVVSQWPRPFPGARSLVLPECPGVFFQRPGF